MNERQLKSFLKAADLGSFSRAAAETFITTPAFVQQINLLEDSLGFPLFLRNKRGITLTEAGQVFYQAAEEILSIYEEACRKGLSLSEEVSRHLKVGCPPEQFPAFVHAAFRAFQESRPEVQVDFVASSLSQHLQDLRKGTIDLCFLAEPDERYLEKLVFLPLFQDTFCFCMKSDHPLAGHAVLAADDLRGYSVLCGNYEYLKTSMEGLLPEGVNIYRLKTEYDSATQSRSMFSEDILMIHSRWASCYSAALTVIPSDLPAGSVGAVARSPVSPVIRDFLSCIRD